jgi:hypothetical protein
MSDKFVLSDPQSELAWKYPALKELAVQDGGGKSYRAFSSQFSPLASNWRGDFECWGLENGIVAIEDLTAHKGRQEKYISCHFIVPAYQRGYRWDEEMVCDLLTDIYANFNKYYEKIKLDIAPEKTWYCIQPLVVRPAPEFLNTYFVIDGQQRLTTLAIFLYALRSLLPSETLSRNAIISLSYESRPESGDFLYGLAEYCAEALEKVKEHIKTYPGMKDRIKAARENISEQPADLDSRYMLNTYLYAYWYFYERIYEAEKAEDFFSFARQDWKKGDRLDPKCFALFEKMILEQTSVIWYNTKNTASEEDDHIIFENFNSGKIELTNAELIKGIFMNPDNYAEKQNGALNEKIKTRQIMIGGEWDGIERSLHDPHVWDFIPHLTARDDEDKYPATRIDALLTMYVYFNLDKSETMKFDEEYFTFKIINKRIYDKLQNLRKEQIEGGKRDVFDAMLGFWNDVKRLYHVFLEWYKGDSSLPNMNSLYHRISLFRRLNWNTGDTHDRRYRTDLEEMKAVFKTLQSCRKSKRVDCINKIILDKLQTSGTPEGIKGLIRTTNYAGGRKVEALLLAFNLATLEGARGYGGRFPFFTYKDEQWEKEHIFANNTVLAKEGKEGKEFLKTLTSDSEIRAYKNYRSFFQGSDLDVNEDDDGIIDFTVYDAKIDALNTVINDDDETVNQQIKEIPETDLMDILRDNQMGNMALLPKRNNIIVSNKSFYDKAKEIKNMFKQGDFIPICTMNVFCDFYTDGDGVSDKRGRHWLYEKRLAYIDQMIKSVSDYLLGAGVKNDE